MGKTNALIPEVEENMKVSCLQYRNACLTRAWSRRGNPRGSCLALI